MRFVNYQYDVQWPMTSIKDDSDIKQVKRTRLGKESVGRSTVGSGAPVEKGEGTFALQSISESSTM